MDGCPVACGKKIFERLGLPYTHFVTTDFGVQKGKTEITEDLIDDIFKKISEKI